MKTDIPPTDVISKQTYSFTLFQKIITNRQELVYVGDVKFIANFYGLKYEHVWKAF